MTESVATRSAPFAEFVIGQWNVQNPDRGEWLTDKDAKLLIAGSYSFHPDGTVDLHHVYRDNMRSDIEIRRHGGWRILRGTQVFLTFPDDYQEIFVGRSAGTLERTLAFGRIWEQRLIVSRL